jgi:ABC-type Mn2+/Zn2+ transport system permease subunit
MLSIADALTEPWRLEFMQRALVATALASATAAVVGCYVVLRGMAFLGDALPHATFSGVAAAFLLGGNVYLGGAVAAVLASLLMGLLGRRGLLKHDTAVGVVLAMAFALGLLLASRRANYAVNLSSFIFGSPLTVGWGDIWAVAAIGGGVLALVALFWKELLVTTYDPAMAAALGIPVALVEQGLMLAVALCAVVALKAVGIVLVMALLVVPAATAQLLARSLPAMMAMAVGVGLLSSLVGLYLAYYADVSPSASVVLTAAAIFFLTLLARRGPRLLIRRAP